MEAQTNSEHASPSSTASSMPVNRPSGRRVRRRADLLSAQVDEGVIVYDPATGVAHHLTSPLLDVWDACEEGLTEGEILDRCGVSGDRAGTALAWLDEAGFLVWTGGPLSRRKVLVGAAAIAGSAAASSIVLPTAAAASSGNPQQPPGCPHVSAWCFAVWATTPCYWTRCDESQPTHGSQCVDYSGNRRNGYYQGTCVTTSGAIGCDSDPGVHVTGAGSSGNVCFTRPSTRTWSCGGFFSPSAACSATNGIGLLSCGQTSSVDLSIQTIDKQVCWVVTTAQGGKISKTVSAPLGTGGSKLLNADGTGSSTWHFVVLSWTGYRFTVTVDGVTDAQLVPPHATSADGGDSLTQCYGGNSVTGLNYFGGIDEVICWDSALSEWQLGPLFASSLAGGQHQW